MQGRPSKWQQKVSTRPQLIPHVETRQNIDDDLNPTAYHVNDETTMNVEGEIKRMAIDTPPTRSRLAKQSKGLSFRENAFAH
mmetsp:Transcript_7955/g.11844  ORF Transcript_7955/g.11844 Transcript_7955/m.11844 type:complete len:82 (-) Transcript_7955:177-422(-)